MAELSYVLITPYALLKSRTGGIMGRLLSDPHHDLVGLAMLSPSREFLDAYAKTFEETDLPEGQKKELVSYVRTRFVGSEHLGITNRALFLLIRSETNSQELREQLVGGLEAGAGGGNTIRGIYADYLRDDQGKVYFFEPAVLTGVNAENGNRQLRLFLEKGLSGTGLVENALRTVEQGDEETTLVILKPENFFRRSSRAGNIITTFSRTKLKIVGARLLRLSIRQAFEFYGPLLDVFRKKLRFKIGEAIRKNLAPHLEYRLDEKDFAAIEELLAEKNARAEFNKIVQFMTGVHPDQVRPEDEDKPGRSHCLALLYRGQNAVALIRERLGATDPLKADIGTVRAEFATTLMINSAHASDSIENAVRERRIIGLLENDGGDCKKILRDYFERGTIPTSSLGDQPPIYPGK